MSFNESTTASEFFEQLSRFIGETDKLISSKQLREILNKYTGENRKDFWQNTELIDRSFEIEELILMLEELINMCDEQFEKYDKEVLELAVTISKLEEKNTIYTKLQSLIKNNLSSSEIEEKMTEEFGNVYVWKKEFSPDFLILLTKYAKDSCIETKNLILEELKDLIFKLISPSETSDSIIICESEKNIHTSLADANLAYKN